MMVKSQIVLYIYDELKTNRFITISDIINNHLLTDYSEDYLIFILIYMCTHSQHNSLTDQRHISQ